MNRRYSSPIMVVISLMVQPLAYERAWANDDSLISEPTAVNCIYSDVNMRLSLAIKQDMAACVADRC